MNFLDISPTAVTIDIGIGKGVEVRGVSIGLIAVLLKRFPALLNTFAGQKVDFADLIASAPDTVAAIIAAAVSPPEDADRAEEVARKLPIGAQVEILEQAFTLSFPGRGVGPFVALVSRVASSMNTSDAEAPADPVADRSMNSPQGLSS
jgi:hypothetical protein